jgi:hypothetical protein
VSIFSLDLAGDLAGLSPREVVEFGEGVELFGENEQRKVSGGMTGGRRELENEQEGQSSL